MNPFLGKWRKVLHFTSFIFGVSPFGNGILVILDVLNLLWLLTWIVLCVLSLHPIECGQGGGYSTFKSIILFVGSHTWTYSCILGFLEFQFKRNRIKDLIEMSDRLSHIYLDGCSGQTRKKLQVPAIFSFYFLYLAISIGLGHFIPSKMYNKCGTYCSMAFFYPSVIVFLQFLYWVQFYHVIFETSIEKLKRNLTNSHFTTSNSLSDLQTALEFKSKICRTYNFGIAMNQLQTCLSFINGIIKISLSGIGRKKFITIATIFQLVVFVAKSYLPHRTGQVSWSEVSHISLLGFKPQPDSVGVN